MLIAFFLRYLSYFLEPMKKGNIILKYTNFTLNYNVQDHAAVNWHYRLSNYTKKGVPRPKEFYLDPKLDLEFQQKSTKSYHCGTTNSSKLFYYNYNTFSERQSTQNTQSPNFGSNYFGNCNGDLYDRGHLVPSTHMNKNVGSRHESHYMTNILPQISTLNRGIWLETEQITGHFAKNNSVEVFGGVIFNDTGNDHFLESHGVKTPEYFYKIIKIGGNDSFTLSWFIPNKPNLKDLSYYELSVKDINREVEYNKGEKDINREVEYNKGEKDINCEVK